MAVVILSFLFTNIAIFLVIYQYTYVYTSITIYNFACFTFPKYCICIQNFPCLWQLKLHSTFICMAEVPLWCWISICKVKGKLLEIFKSTGWTSCWEKLEELFIPHKGFTASALLQRCRKQNNRVNQLKCSLDTLIACEQALWLRIGWGETGKKE